MRIVYEPKAAAKCRTWSANAGLDAEGKGSLIEVGGLGLVRVEKPDTFIIEDVFLLEQEGSGAEYTAKADAVAKFYVDLIRGGGDPGTVLHFWHSHANMNVFQSGTDRDNVKDTFNKKSFCVAVTWNAKGDTYGEVTLFRPIEMRIDNVKVEVALPYDAALLVELREKVKPRVYTHAGVAGDAQMWVMGQGWIDVGGHSMPTTRDNRVQTYANAINIGNGNGSGTINKVEDIKWDWSQGRWYPTDKPRVFEPGIMDKKGRKEARKALGAGIDTLIGAYVNEDPIEVVYDTETVYLFAFDRDLYMGANGRYVQMKLIEEKLAAIDLFREVFRAKIAKKQLQGWQVPGEGRQYGEFPGIIGVVGDEDIVQGATAI